MSKFCPINEYAGKCNEECAWWHGDECAILTIARVLHNNREDAQYAAEREHSQKLWATR